MTLQETHDEKGKQYMTTNDLGKETCKLHRSEVERLLGWLRCYPVEGRENERKSLEALLEMSLSLSADAIPLCPSCQGVMEPHGQCSQCGEYPNNHMPAASYPSRYVPNVNKGQGTCEAFTHKHALHTKNAFCKNWEKSTFLAGESEMEPDRRG